LAGFLVILIVISSLGNCYLPIKESKTTGGNCNWKFSFCIDFLILKLTMELNYLFLYILSYIPCDISQYILGFLAYPLGNEIVYTAFDIVIVFQKFVASPWEIETQIFTSYLG